MKTEKNVFITDDILIEDFESRNIDRYEFTENKESFIDFLNEDTNKPKREELKKMTMDELKEKYPEEYEKWQDEASQEERFEIPMMNALRYYPSFVSFDEEDRYKVIGATTLLYDNEKGAWAVGMTGGGMDLSPCLLATFINLEKGVPSELATAISLNYSAYLDKKTHKENCRLLAKALRDQGERYEAKADELEGKEGK